MAETKAVQNVDTIDLHDDLHTRVVVAEGTGKTANQEGAKAKVVHNVSDCLPMIMFGRCCTSPSRFVVIKTLTTHPI